MICRLWSWYSTRKLPHTRAPHSQSPLHMHLTELEVSVCTKFQIDNSIHVNSLEVIVPKVIFFIFFTSDLNVPKVPHVYSIIYASDLTLDNCLYQDSSGQLYTCWNGPLGEQCTKSQTDSSKSFGKSCENRCLQTDRQTDTMT